MPVLFRCPNCNRKLSASKRHIGKKKPCPACKINTYIPNPNPRTPMPVAATPPAPQPQPAAMQDGHSVSAGLIKNILDVALEDFSQGTLRKNASVWDYANNGIIAQTFAANHLGLPEAQRDKLVDRMMPYPDKRGNNVQVINTHAPPAATDNPVEVPENVDGSTDSQEQPPPSLMQKLAPWIVGGLIGAGGAGAGAALSQYFQPDTIINTPDDGIPGEIGLEVE